MTEEMDETEMDETEMDETRMDSTEDELPESTFVYEESIHDFRGELHVRGYAATEEITEPFCAENCDTFTYVFLQLDESFLDDSDLQRFFEIFKGNAFVSDGGLGLGCVENGQIFTHNDFDYSIAEQLSVEDTEALLNSSASEMVKVHLERRTEYMEGEAPACFSHFVIKSVG